MQLEGGIDVTQQLLITQIRVHLIRLVVSFSKFCVC